MSLMVNGKCVYVEQRSYTSKEDGLKKHMNSAMIVDPDSGAPPVMVSTFELVLIRDEWYEIPVRAGIYHDSVQFACIKNSPPKAIMSLTDKAPK